jgi:uncharacterized membrane protein
MNNNRLVKKKQPDKVVATPSNAQGVTKQVMTMQRHSIHSGPLPTPEIFQKYDVILPGAAERIMRMAEGESAHRCSMEVSILQEQSLSDVRRSAETKRGQIFGLIAVCCIVMLSAYALWLGMEKAAIGLGGITIVGLVTAFVKGREK